MRIGAFELDEPIPELREPHVLAMLDPWIDVGSAGTLTLAWLEKHFDAEDVGRIARPGNFFDFTRYRPTIYYDEEDKRQVAVPNTYMTWGRGKDNDFIFLHLLEPHSHSDLYIESMVKVLVRLGVKRYCLLGSMYDYVPHTMPLLVTGSASGSSTATELEGLGIESGKYQGPTTITTLITQKALQLGMETMSLIVHIPQYTQLEEDYSGAARLMDMVSSIYGGIPVDKGYYEKAQEQADELNQALIKNPQLKDIIKEMEAEYGQHPRRRPERQPPLSPEIERFLSEMEHRFGDEPGKGPRENS